MGSGADNVVIWKGNPTKPAQMPPNIKSRRRNAGLQSFSSQEFRCGRFCRESISSQSILSWLISSSQADRWRPFSERSEVARRDKNSIHRNEHHFSSNLSAFVELWNFPGTYIGHLKCSAIVHDSFNLLLLFYRGHFSLISYDVKNFEVWWGACSKTQFHLLACFHTTK